MDKRKQNTSPEDYYLAGRKSKLLPVMFSYIVTFQSSILYLGFPAEGYIYGPMYSFYGLSKFITLLFTAFFIVPVFHPLKLTSIYEYLNLRYGDNVLRILAMTFGVVYQVFYMSTVTYGTCVALEVVMGIPYWITIVLYTSVTSVYTSIGGIKAVIWADVFQFVIMLTGFIAVFVKATLVVGGFVDIIHYAGDRFTFMEFRFDPRIRLSFWNVTVGSLTSSLYFSYSQSAMQRVYTLQTVKSAKMMFLLSIPIYAPLMVIAVLEGGFIFAYYAFKGCDIFASGKVQNVNEIVPFAIIDIFRNQPGLPGLFIAALSAAALSTLSSCLSSLSAIVYQDIIKLIKPDMTTEFSTKISRIVTLVFGVFALLVSFLLTSLPGSVIALFQRCVACMDGPTCAIFLLSAMFKRATTKGVLLGALCGSAVALWLNLGQLYSNLPKDPPLPPGPTYNCENNMTLNSEFDVHLTNTSAYEIWVNTNVSATTIVNKSSNSVSELGLKQLYRTSFVLFSLVGFLVSILVAIPASLCTAHSTTVDERCLFSFRKHVLKEQCEDSWRSNHERNKISAEEETSLM
ncbi:sodium-coupled monocarboxylate transporter 1-like [Mya arenaria]|uniref:sodium-coupled monocarboxylate transporter 1-like n=1 Tax=Mya arenaria TaxID=6604 RepID=UPI0022E08A8D|nr:sodium-coupled monocarboxylate transporter 1-like [Mya arenaria]